MKISLAYRLWKEGKIHGTREQMSSLWSFYEQLNPYNCQHRLIRDAYMSLQKKYFDGDEEAKEDFVGTFNRYFEADLEDPKSDHTHLLK